MLPQPLAAVKRPGEVFMIAKTFACWSV